MISCKSNNERPCANRVICISIVVAKFSLPLLIMLRVWSPWVVTGLANKYCTTEHNVSFYAGQLNLSPNRLSAVIKAYSGKTVMQWLHHRLVLQAKVLLQNSQLSIGNIASCLGFKNQAEFTRFFKRATGITPKEYKNN